MSSDTEEAAEEVCANCGKSAVDDVKLKICTACRLVKYCCVECQKNHRPQHKKACKKKMAEIRDDKLFTQPDESHLGECPICCLPLPLDLNKSTINSCCYKIICLGCDNANQTRQFEEGLERRCPYCREPLPGTREEGNQNCMKRAKANDPVALCKMGKEHRDRGQYDAAFTYFKKAAELGLADAHFELSVLYIEGEGVERDMKKGIHHLEEAAIGGHPIARFNLGCIEWESGRHDRAAKHFIIAAKLGDDEALGAVKKRFMKGYVSKEEYESTLRGHQGAVDATKSQQREKAYKRLL